MAELLGRWVRAELAWCIISSKSDNYTVKYLLEDLAITEDELETIRSNGVTKLVHDGWEGKEMNTNQTRTDLKHLLKPVATSTMIFSGR